MPVAFFKSVFADKSTLTLISPPKGSYGLEKYRLLYQFLYNITFINPVIE